MNVGAYRLRNLSRRIWGRVSHPPPLYKKVGGINAVVHRANGRVENLGNISATYSKRWGTEAGSKPPEKPDA